jgi:hypothetical protein
LKSSPAHGDTNQHQNWIRFQCNSKVSDKTWLVSFLQYDLGFFDKEEGRVEPAPNPFVPAKVLTM